MTARKIVACAVLFFVIPALSGCWFAAAAGPRKARRKSQNKRNNPVKWKRQGRNRPCRFFTRDPCSLPRGKGSGGTVQDKPAPLARHDDTFVHQLHEMDVGLVEGEELVKLGKLRPEDDA
jgi:hypothetical protein